MADKIFRKRILLPLWIIQSIALVVLVGLTALGLWAVDDVQDEKENGDINNSSISNHDFRMGVTTLNALFGTLMAVSILTILLNILELVLVIRNKLKPIPNLVVQCIKSAIWAIFFLLVIVAIVKGGTSGLIVFVPLLIFATSLGLLAYASVIVHRYRRGTLSKASGVSAEHGEAGTYEMHRDPRS